jgi:phytoene dehydrogenase-like protein
VTLDAIVVGAGPNGLVAANVLADAGWSVLVLEARAHSGGAVRTAELTVPGFRNDLFSAFYPFAAASPILTDLKLERFGLEWLHAPKVVAHPFHDRPAAVLSRDITTTAQSLERDAPGDGDRFQAMFGRWMEISEPFVGSLLRPFPPVRDATRLLLSSRLDGTLDLARMSLLPLRRFVEEEFGGQAAAMLFAGNALHADLTPDMSGSALFGWLLVCLGQQYGFPVPAGGAGELAGALLRRAEAGGVEIRLGQRVSQIVVSSGRSIGVTTSDGERIASRVVVADCDAARLLLGMVGEDHLPAAYVRRLRRIQRAAATFKVDWALSSPVPWTDSSVAGAGTVHVSENLDELTVTAAQLAMNHVPALPFLVVGQMTTADPTRSPPGTESMWAYTHVPQNVLADDGGDGLTGAWTQSEVDLFACRVEARIEALAPGFTSSIMARHVMAPGDLQSRDENLLGGDISGGTSQLHQQLLFRPVAGWARPETPIGDLYLASASAHPGGGVHGAPGNNAARAALLHHPVLRAARTAVSRRGRLEEALAR